MRRFALLTLIAVTLLAPSLAHADKPIQLSLFTPIQIFPASESIKGFRFNLLYGRNQGMKGFDWGLVNHVGSGEFKGLQLGVVGITQGPATGVQWGAVSLSLGSMHKGVQFGTVNYAKNLRGAQIGLVNIAERIYGIQFGLINIIKSGGWLPVMILINGGF